MISSDALSNLPEFMGFTDRSIRFSFNGTKAHEKELQKTETQDFKS